MKRVFFVSVMFFVSPFLFAAGDSEGTGKIKEISIGLDDVPGSIAHTTVEKFRDHIQESRPDISFVVYPASQLGDHRAMTAQLRAGELDVQQLAFPNLSYLIPELKLSGEPYVIKDFAHLKRVMAGPYGEEMSQKIEALGMKLLDISYFGTRQTTSNIPIESVDDMVGLKIRVPDVDFLVDYASAVHAIPAPISFHELYLALQTHQVDAQENPLPTIDLMKFYEVQDYIAMTNHFIASHSIFVNLDLWNSMTAAEQALFQEAANLASDYQTAEVMQQERDLVAVLEEKGVTFTYPDTAPFQRAMQPYYDELEDKFGSGSISDLINY